MGVNTSPASERDEKIKVLLRIGRGIADTGLSKRRIRHARAAQSGKVKVITQGLNSRGHEITMTEVSETRPKAGHN